MSAVLSCIDALAARFAARAYEEAAAIDSALDIGDRAQVQSRAHKLAGIAEMFGFPDLGKAALTLELQAESGEPIDAAGEIVTSMLRAIAR